MATKPKIVGNEVALPPAEVERLLRALPPATILVGGQALGFWMLRFGLLRADGDDSAVTRDADLIGAMDDAEQLASVLHGQLIVPHERARTGLVAQVRLPVPDTDRHYNIDILHQLFAVGGLRKSAEFTRRARNRASIVKVSEIAQFRILHPLDVLASRVNNAAGLLDEKGEHVLTQARWAIAVARHALAADRASSPPGTNVQAMRHRRSAALRVARPGGSSLSRTASRCSMRCRSKN